MNTANTSTDARPASLPLTNEQLAVINSSGNMRINAVAGSGKTTTVLEYAASKPANARILYLAFNKSVKLEAARKFAERGLHNVRVETAHSLAYRYVMHGSTYKVRPQGYKTHEIAELLSLKGNGEKHAEYIIANHINKFITYFCNSDKHKVQDLDYLETVTDSKAKVFVRTFYKYIESSTRQLLGKMDKGEIEIIHDFYLKKFQLESPLLPYDYILFDEGQDASGAMLDVFIKQQAVKVIVGDSHQQIYSWRHAVNSLAKTDFDSVNLSASFRFTQDIANLAMNILDWKEHLSGYNPVSIKGKGNSSKEISKATIARTNLGLLLKAIEFITDNRSTRHIYFEGNIHSYTYADDGASLYDVLNLHNHKHDRIQDKLIKSMKNMEELEEYIEKTEDAQLSMMVEIVKEYENEIPAMLKSLKSLHVGDEDRHKAEMVFSTVHRAKGMEYDVVHLVDDFVTEAKLEKLKKEQKDGHQQTDITKWNEEINLLYVAITRTRNKLFIPDTLLPKSIPASPYINIVKTKKQEDATNHYYQEYESFLSKQIPPGKKSAAKEIKEKAYSVAQKRESYKDAYKPWTWELDNELKKMYDSGVSISKMAAHFGRTKGAILSRLKKLDYLSG